MKYIGILLIVIATILLVVSYFSGTLVDFNWYNLSALVLMILGIIAHIVLNKFIR